jgi:hypothetical protein
MDVLVTPVPNQGGMVSPLTRNWMEPLKRPVAVFKLLSLSIARPHLIPSAVPVHPPRIMKSAAISR